MALVEEFEKQGQFLFRWRSYIPGLILLVMAFSFPEYRFPDGSYGTHLIFSSFAFLISFSGLAVRCFTIGYTPAMTSGRNTKKQVAETVNQTGIYSQLRHPLYLGNFLMYLGVVLFLRDFGLTIIFILAFWVYYERIMFTEEQFLRGKFGNAYTGWANRIPAFIPAFKNYTKPNLEFSFRNIIKREYSSYFGIVAIFTLMDMASVYFNEQPELSFSGALDLLKPVTMGFFLQGLAFYTIVRIIVKTTKWLHVEGR